MEITCDGIIIHETTVGESDKIVTFLTADYGKITVSAKGVRNMKSKNSSAVQLFCSSSFEMLEKNGRYILKTALINDSHYAVRSSIERFSLASYFAEIAATVCSENNDERDMLRLMLNSFYAMAHCPDIPLWRIKAAFEMKCMEVSGFAPDFSSCAECGKPSADSTDGNGMYLFSPADGAVLCPECLAGRDKSNMILLSAAAVDAALYIISSPQSRMLKFVLPDSEAETSREELCELCEKYLCFQTARRYETLNFYKSMANAK